jgi:D-hexose-6-phosphate mutarotase
MESKAIAALNQRFAIPGHVNFSVGQGGLAKVNISNPYSSGTVMLYGGHVTSFIPKREGKNHDVLWMSPSSPFEVGKAMRGGIPVCWPWFGAHPSEPEKLPAHGFARTIDWTPVLTRAYEDGSTELHLLLRDSEETRALWPHAFELEIQIVFGKGLSVDLAARNPGIEPYTYTAALHSYFYVSDVSRVSVLGLEGCEYLDKVENYAHKRQQGTVNLVGQTDRVYIDTDADSVIVDPGLERKIRIAKRNSRTTVVWNPGEIANKMMDVGAGSHVNFVCVETANAGQDIIQVPAGGEAHLAALISVE